MAPGQTSHIGPWTLLPVVPGGPLATDWLPAEAEQGEEGTGPSAESLAALLGLLSGQEARDEEGRQAGRGAGPGSRGDPRGESCGGSTLRGCPCREADPPDGLRTGNGSAVSCRGRWHAPVAFGLGVTCPRT